MINRKFLIPGLTFSEGNTTDLRLPKGALLDRLIIDGSYTDTISVAATSARTRGVPIQLVQLLGDGGELLHSWRPLTLIHEAEIYEQTALAAICAPPTGLGPAAVTGTFSIPLMFAEPFAFEPIRTALPTWLFDELILRITWGDHSNVYVGGTGVISIAAGQAVNCYGVSIVDDFHELGDPFVWGRALGQSLRSYREVAAPAAITDDYTVEAPRTADIRSIIYEALDANGDPSNAIIEALTLKVNNVLAQFENVGYRVVRADNARLFGVTMPPGVAILEFAEDKDIVHILEAPTFTALDSLIDTSATAGTIRVNYKRIRARPGTN